MKGTTRKLTGAGAFIFGAGFYVFASDLETEFDPGTYASTHRGDCIQAVFSQNSANTDPLADAIIVERQDVDNCLEQNRIAEQSQNAELKTEAMRRSMIASSGGALLFAWGLYASTRKRPQVVVGELMSTPTIDNNKNTLDAG